MGTYHEPRVPQGAPVDGEKDVWLEDGKVKFGHYVAASSSWAVDKEIDYNGISDADKVDGYHASSFATSGHDHSGTYSILSHNHSGTYEPAFSKNTAFNKNFAGTGSAATPARSDHTHGGTFAGDADTVDGRHASEMVSVSADEWHYVGGDDEPAFGDAWHALADTAFKNINGIVYLKGKALSDHAYTNIIFTLPAGYRPPEDKDYPYHCQGEGNLHIAANGEVTGDPLKIAWFDGISFLTE